MALGDLDEVTRLAALTGPWICLEDKVGQALRPRKTCTWAQRGNTPVVRVSENSGRQSVAGMACLKPGQPGRIYYRLRVHRRRKGERASMCEADYAHLITSAHRALNAPVIFVWDNHNTHRSRKIHAVTEARHEWLTFVQLYSYAPDLNAVESDWSAMKSGLGNHTADTLDQLEAMVHSRQRTIQRRPDLINALRGQTGLELSNGEDFVAIQPGWLGVRELGYGAGGVGAVGLVSGVL